MLTAFIYSADGSTQRINTLEAVQAVWEQPDTRLWIDLETPEESELLAIKETFQLDEEAIQDCLQGEQWPRIDDFDQYFFMVCYGLFGLKERSDVDPHKLAVFCGPRFLITVSHEPLLTVRQVKARCGRHSEAVIARGVDYTLCTIIDQMVDNYLRVAERYEKRLDELEDQSFSHDVDESLLSGLAELRRDLLELRRLAASQLELLRPMILGEYDFVSPSLSQEFQRVCDHLSQVIETVNGLRELLSGVYNNYHSVLTGRTNETMKVLTVFNGILLPLTLLSGIYGMNVPLPMQHHDLGFWVVIGGMLVVAAGLYWFFRRRRWL